MRSFPVRWWCWVDSSLWSSVRRVDIEILHFHVFLRSYGSVWGDRWYRGIQSPPSDTADSSPSVFSIVYVLTYRCHVLRAASLHAQDPCILGITPIFSRAALVASRSPLSIVINWIFVRKIRYFIELPSRAQRDVSDAIDCYTSLVLSLSW